MKTARALTCLLAGAVVLLLASAAFGQRRPTPAQLQQSNKESQEYFRKERETDSATEQDKNAVASDHLSIAERLEANKIAFGGAEKMVANEGEKPLLFACRELSGTAIPFGLFTERYIESHPEVCRAVFAGPFLDRVASQVLLQALQVQAYNEFMAAFRNYSKVLKSSDEKTRLDVMVAISRSREEKYQYRVDHCLATFKAHGHTPDWDCFFADYLGLNLSPNSGLPGAKQHLQKVQGWKGLFEELDKNQPGDNSNVHHSGLTLLLDCGSPLGSPFNKMPSRAKLMFAYQQKARAWQDFINPSEEILKNLPRFTYWARDPDPNEPSLTLKVQVPHNLYISGHEGMIRWNLHLPTSFFRGLVQDTSGDPVGFYRDRFDEQLMKWHPISIVQYNKLRVEEEAWVKTHTDSTAFIYKQGIRARFEEISPHYITGDCQQEYSLESLQSVPRPVVTAKVASK